MVRSLVTGGAGFIGSHVAKHLVSKGHQVVILDDLSGGFVENIPSGAEFVQGSILDERLVHSLFEEHHFDYVYHLAAYAAEGLSHFIRRFNYSNNLIGSVNLINESVNSQVKCFVFTSSIAVYGAGQVPMTEEMMPLPEDPYGVAKLAVEQDLKAAHHLFGMNYIIFRPHNVYGEKQNIADRYRNVVGIFMNQLLKGEMMTIFGDGDQQRAFTYIDDVAPTIARSVEVPQAINQIFNIGADVPFSVNTLARVIAEAMQRPCNVVHLPERQEAKLAFSDHSKVSRVFGERTKVKLHDGIAKMAQWVRAHGSRESSIFGDVEIEQKMPPSWAAFLKTKLARPEFTVQVRGSKAGNRMVESAG
jgi:UDP-glucose 4-epimerase